MNKEGDSITFIQFSQLCRNLGYPVVLKKEKYTYEDLLQLFSENHSRLDTTIDKSLGLQFILNRDISFPMNPYSILPEYQLITSAENRLVSLENSIFQQQVPENIRDNTIFVCLAENILSHFEIFGINPEVFPYFFPILSNKGILSNSELLKSKQKRLKETQRLLDERSLTIYQNVDLLYDIYRESKTPLPYIERGISSIDICVYPENEFHIPLDSIFKTVHVTEQIPFIKYNPGTRRENIYRLYSIQINKYGKKIPYLRRAKILQLSKDLREIGKSGQITFYLQFSPTIDIHITITGNANVYINIVLEKAIQLSEIDAILKDSVNHILSNIPYPLPRFYSFYSENAKILKMNYRCKLPIKRKFSLFKEGYISAIFQVIEDNISRDAIMKYRRVDNFEEMNPESALILEWFNSTVEKGRDNQEEFIRELMNFSGIEREQALMKLNVFLRDHTIINGKYSSSTNTILENAGFLTRASIITDEDIVLINLEHINSAIYIQPIETYIDSILRLKQYPETITISPERIGTASAVANVKGANKPYNENIVEVNAEVIKFKKTNYLSLFNDDDDDSDEDKEPVKEYEDDDQEPSASKNDLDHVFDHLDDYKDADLDFEILSDIGENESPNNEEESSSKLSDVPQASINASKDVDSSDSDSDDEQGIVFGGNNQNDRFPYREVHGGTSSMNDETYERDLDGKPLKIGNDNIILNRLKKREPRLFLSKDAENGLFDRYSRLCPAYRQPVIISEEEKTKIDAEHPGSYSQATKYGTDPENPNWYICPRYWCLKTNTSLTYEQVQSGVCGKVIPQGEDVIRPGHYVYEFNRGVQHSNSDGSYHDNKPGFLTKDNHPDGYCLPCCFKEWNKPQRDKQAACMKKEPQRQRNIHANKARTILKVESIPLDPSRYGFLPLNVERFLGINHQTEVQPDNPSILKPDGETFLRFGVQQTSKKSFIGCIADLYSRKRKLAKMVSIPNMCEIIANAVTLDMFIRLNNGALPAVFTPRTTESSNIDNDEIINSMFRTTIDMTNETQRDFFQQTVDSFYAFREFMINDDSYIDYTYLWDIICIPNPRLFETGLNLAVLDLTQNDSTDNIALICPSSAYSKTYYDPKKETFILLKLGSIFEPIYLVNLRQITPTFFEEHTLNQSLKQVLNIIRYSSQKYCSPLPSIQQYEFKRNKLAEEVYLNLLRKSSYNVTHQILNFQGKTIGFKVYLSEGESIFIPTLPSSTISGLPIQYIENDELWQSYEFTRDMLLRIKHESNGNILCQPMIKVIEDGMIIGIITETNQFIQLDEPTEDIFEDALITVTNNNYILADTAISTGKEDSNRRNMIKRIELESRFYSAFRSFIRWIINLPENREYKMAILKYIENRRGKYTRLYGLRKIEETLRALCINKIQFYEYDDESILFDLHEITNCQNASDQGKPFCFSVPNSNTRGMLIPKYHMISGGENSIIYFKRMSDELLRYKRIQPYILEPNRIFNIRNVDYQLNNNEMILLESFLVKEHFDNFIPFSQNESTKITYEFATQDPRISQNYNDVVEYEKQVNTANIPRESEIDILCMRTSIPIKGNPATSMWKQMFPDLAKEFVLSATRECSFYPIIYIMRDIYKSEVSVSQIKETLKNTYIKNYIELYFDKILTLLKKQGKKDMVKRILEHSDPQIRKTVFQEWILSESYYLTDLDIWVLAQELSLPIILFTSTTLKNLLESASWIVMGRNSRTDKYYFIRAYSSIKSDEYHDYHIITPSLSLSELKSFKSKDGPLFLKDIIRQEVGGETYTENLLSLKEYFERYRFVKFR